MSSKKSYVQPETKCVSLAPHSLMFFNVSNEDYGDKFGGEWFD